MKRLRKLIYMECYRLMKWSGPHSELVQVNIHYDGYMADETTIELKQAIIDFADNWIKSVNQNPLKDNE